MCAPRMRLGLRRAAILLFFSLFIMEQGTLPKDANAAQPSFDCSKATSWSEREVCRNEILAGLDVKLASLYKAKRAQLDGIQETGLIGDQKQWLRDRDNCNFSPSPSKCLIDIYNKRISALSIVGDNRDEPLKQSAEAQINQSAPGTSSEQVPLLNSRGRFAQAESKKTTSIPIGQSCVSLDKKLQMFEGHTVISDQLQHARRVDYTDKDNNVTHVIVRDSRPKVLVIYWRNFEKEAIEEVSGENELVALLQQLLPNAGFMFDCNAARIDPNAFLAPSELAKKEQGVGMRDEEERAQAEAVYFSEMPGGKALNLIVLVHGCCTTADHIREWEGLARTITEELVKKHTPSAWEIVVWDWHKDEKTGVDQTPVPPGPLDWFHILQYADIAYTYASVEGQKLADAIDEYPKYTHIHLVAHSAGAKLIDQAAKNLAVQKNRKNKDKPFIHLTFLDAYTRTDHDRTVYGSLPNDYPHYAEHYVHISGLKVADAILLHAYNFDITEWHPDNAQEKEEKEKDWGHQWPRYWYEKSVTSTGFKCGFALSVEGGNNKINSLPKQNPAKEPLRKLDNADCAFGDVPSPPSPVPTPTPSRP